ncbi:hypothetical protein HK097_007686 [Rhizophlyctis rosea]|uniref:Amino acid permease/ SLC12A domain-containing protein n=1 Tax=Rhizophlyctis rosea TaxID=64517 RepID=A0AAD5X237_9FUNG|nr:hypothetical protein HK097_007686 [Rhizophlyctis rosea]
MSDTFTSSTSQTTTNEALPLEKGIKREMTPRHIGMISIGGTIGTGLFVASGGTIATAGPAGALIAYAFIGFTVFCIMTCLGKMSTLLPISIQSLCVELAAAGLIIQYWQTPVPTYVWALIILLVIIVFNMFGGNGYGETEYWLSLIKIITVLVFIIVGILVAAGAVGGHTYGFENWREPGAFVTEGDYGNAFANLLSVCLTVGYAYQGTEMVGIVAGETKNPHKSVPRAIRNVFWRILLFFLCSIFLIGLIIPSTDGNLLDASEDNIAIAPFSIVFQRANLPSAADVMNAILLTVLISASNSALYCGSRTMMAMAREGKAPRIFAWVNKWGVPVPAILVTASFGLIATAAATYSAEEVFAWVLGMASVTGFFSWSGICWTHLRFRRAYVAQGRDVRDLPYRAWAYPFAPIFGGTVTALIGVTCGFYAFTPVWDTKAFFQNYINLIFLIVIFVAYKIYYRTSLVPLKDCDFETGARWAPSVENVEAEDIEAKKKKTIPMRLWNGVKTLIA